MRHVDEHGARVDAELGDRARNRIGDVEHLLPAVGANGEAVHAAIVYRTG